MLEDALQDGGLACLVCLDDIKRTDAVRAAVRCRVCSLPDLLDVPLFPFPQALDLQRLLPLVPPAVHPAVGEGRRRQDNGVVG